MGGAENGSSAGRGKLSSLLAELRSDSLRGRSLRGSVWTVGGFGSSQLLRLAGNLVLTRLLAPEAFGLMALVGATIQGLEMFSDVGLHSGVIHHERGEEPAFLNTAWTIQFMRGFLLWAVASAIAWPIALAFDEPALTALIIVGGSRAIFTGARSVRFYTLSRRLEIGRLTLYEMGVQVLTVGPMVAWAMLHPSVWALAGGSLIGGILGAGLSHVMLGPFRHRLGMEPAARASLFHFGKWIILSTVVTFVIDQADRFVVGGLTDTTTLGLFSIAVTLASIPDTLVGRVTASVLFPAYARIHREGDRQRLRRQIRRSSSILFAVMIPGFLLLSYAGPWIVELLYDDRYAGAGPMLAIVAAGLIGKGLTNVASIGLLATGDSRSQAIFQAFRLLTFSAAVGVGFALGGLTEFLVAMSIARWIDYLPGAFMLHRKGLWNPAIDLPAMLASAIVIALIVAG